MRSFEANQFIEKLEIVQRQYGLNISQMAGLLDLSKNSLYSLRSGTWTPSGKWFSVYTNKTNKIIEMLEEYKEYVSLSRGHYEFSLHSLLAFMFYIWDKDENETYDLEDEGPTSELDELIKAIRI